MELGQLYRKLEQERGKIANILKVHSLDPVALNAHMALYVHLMFGESGLSREERELIAVAVSVANSCRYCILHHGETLKAYWKDEGRVREFTCSPDSVEMPERARRMVEYAQKLTRSPSEMREEDVERLKEAGLPDRDILRINLIASYFNFVNRIALGLGVQFSPEEISGYRY